MHGAGGRVTRGGLDEGARLGQVASLSGYSVAADAGMVRECKVKGREARENRKNTRENRKNTRENTDSRTNNEQTQTRRAQRDESRRGEQWSVDQVPGHRVTTGP